MNTKSLGCSQNHEVSEGGRMIKNLGSGEGRAPWFVSNRFGKEHSQSRKETSLSWLEKLLRQDQDKNEKETRSPPSPLSSHNIRIPQIEQYDALNHTSNRLRVLITHNPSSHCEKLMRMFDFIIRRPNDLHPNFVTVRTASDVVPNIRSGDLLLRFQLAFFQDHLPQNSLVEMKTRAKLYEYDEKKCKFEPLGKARINLAILEL